MPDWFAQNAPQSTGGGDWFAQNAQKPEPKSLGSQVGDFFSHVASGLNPVNVAKGTADFVNKTLTTNPLGEESPLNLNSAGTQRKIIESVKKGDYLTAARHLAGLLPVVGPSIDAMGDTAQGGDVGAALGDATAFGVLSAAPGSPAVRSGARAATRAAGKAANATARAAAAAPPEVVGHIGGVVGAGAGGAALGPVGSVVGGFAGEAAGRVLSNRLRALAERRVAAAEPAPVITAPVPEPAAAPSPAPTTAAAPRAGIPADYAAVQQWAATQPEGGVTVAAIQRQFGVPYSEALRYADNLAFDAVRVSRRASPIAASGDRIPPGAARAAAAPPEVPAGPTPEQIAAWREQNVQKLRPQSAPPGAAGVEDLSRQLADELGAGAAPPAPAKPAIDYAARARAQKAGKLARFLHADGNGIPAADAAAMDAGMWAQAAKGAGVNAPSPATIDAAIAELKTLEAARPSSPNPARLQTQTADHVASPVPASVDAGGWLRPHEIPETTFEQSRAASLDYDLARQLAGAMRGTITAEQAAKLSPGQWAKAAKAAGMPKPGPKAVKYAIQELRKVDRLNALAESLQ